MSYIYANVDVLEGTNKVGSGGCVRLVQHYAHVPHTSLWREGERVKGNSTIRKGTAIATFVDGKYPNNATGNHAAFYLRQDDIGIWIMDQWVSNTTKPRVSSRRIRFKGQDSDGSFVTPSDNGDAFSVIE
jgi:hypothetical protein